MNSKFAMVMSGKTTLYVLRIVVCLRPQENAREKTTGKQQESNFNLKVTNHDYSCRSFYLKMMKDRNVGLHKKSNVI